MHQIIPVTSNIRNYKISSAVVVCWRPQIDHQAEAHHPYSFILANLWSGWLRVRLTWIELDKFSLIEAIYISGWSFFDEIFAKRLMLAGSYTISQRGFVELLEYGWYEDVCSIGETINQNYSIAADGRVERRQMADNSLSE